MINHTVSARHLAIGLAASIPSPVQALHFLVISAPSARLGFWQHMFTVSGTRQLMYPDTNKASTQHGILSTVVLLCSQLHAPHAAVPHAWFAVRPHIKASQHATHRTLTSNGPNLSAPMFSQSTSMALASCTPHHPSSWSMYCATSTTSSSPNCPLVCAVQAQQQHTQT